MSTPWYLTTVPLPPSFPSFLSVLEQFICRERFICWVGLVVAASKCVTAQPRVIQRHIQCQKLVFLSCAGDQWFSDWGLRTSKDFWIYFQGPQHNSRSTVLSLFAVTGHTMTGFEFFNSWLLLLHIWCEKLGQNLKKYKAPWLIGPYSEGHCRMLIFFFKGLFGKQWGNGI